VERENSVSARKTLFPTDNLLKASERHKSSLTDAAVKHRRRTFFYFPSKVEGENQGQEPFGRRSVEGDLLAHFKETSLPLLHRMSGERHVLLRQRKVVKMWSVKPKGGKSQEKSEGGKEGSKSKDGKKGVI